jgi:hypothetical protein
MLLFRHLTKVLAKETQQHAMRMCYLYHVVYTRIGVCLKYESDFFDESERKNFTIKLQFEYK